MIEKTNKIYLGPGVMSHASPHSSQAAAMLGGGAGGGGGGAVVLGGARRSRILVSE
jgi:hypothetical protein